MAIESDIRDHAYQFFIQEAPELLQLIEEELLTLRQERSIAKIHNMMRAAHSIKGGAASVGLETIKTLAHSLEDIFKALFNEELEIDAEVENLILQAYDCLRLPLMEQLTSGQFDSEQAMANAEPVFAQIEAQLGDFLRGAASNMPSSVDLGVDIALSIFEVDVAQGIERLKNVLADPQALEVAGELRAQAEIFAGLAELLNLPGFGAIASLAIAAIEAHPDQALQVTQVALADFEAARQAVMNGDRIQGGTPSEALTKLANSSDIVTAGNNLFETVGTIDQLLPLQVIPENNIFSNAFASEDVSAISGLDDIFGDALNFEPPNLEPLTAVTPITSGSQVKPIEQENIQSVPDPATTNSNVSLDDLFGDTLNVEPASLDSNPAVTAKPEALPQKQTSIASNEQFPTIQDAANLADNSGAIVPAPVNIPTVAEKAGKVSAAPNRSTPAQKLETTPVQAAAAANLSVRVDVERLERMNNLVGELSINRNGLSLQNTQL